MSASPGRTLILHIGVEKTGSTSLQRALFTHREALARSGCVYPASPSPSRDGNHNLLAAAFLPENERGFVPAEYRALSAEALLAPIRAELAAACAPVVVLSSEHLHSRFHRVEACEALGAFLRDAGFESIKLYAYLRRQDELLESAYREAVRYGFGEAPDAVVRNVEERGEWFAFGDYASVLRRWNAVVPAEDIHVRAYDRRRFVDGSVEADFLAWTGLGEALSLMRDAAQARDAGAAVEYNRSWSALVTLYVARINAAWSADPPPDVDALRAELVRALQEVEGGGARHVFAPAARAALRAAFAEANADVSERFLAPSAGALFADTAPDSGEAAVQLDLEEFARVTSRLLQRPFASREECAAGEQRDDGADRGAGSRAAD